MPRTILKGYLVEETTNLADIEMILYEMRDIVEKRASIAYADLVRWQVERIVDEIAINQFKRPEDSSILDIAAGEVRRRMIYSDKRMQCTEFNISIGIQILVGKYEGKPAIYFKVLCPNDIYSKFLKKIPELVPLDINEDDLKVKKGAKKEFWDSIEGKYQTDIPIIASLLNYDAISINPEEFKFRSPSERAADLAKEKILNQLLSSYACEQEVAPNKLMEYTLQSINRLNYSDIKDLLECEKQNLESFLPEIDLELITKIGSLPSQKEAPDTTEENKEDISE
ncbi:hypothetical protein [Blautia sp. 1033sp1_1033st1_G9_1033SCRN_220408]|uniref:hypothetical protein n=1 Tax=Blautia sp. 1033sp1_1033st1_G9_1033SCRN_220408 TaxID=3144490 RepID=UPI0034A576C8